MSVEERTVAVVPNVGVMGVTGMKRYGLVVTNRRLVFALESASRSLIGGMLGGAVGAMIGEAAASRRAIDYARTSPDALARDRKNVKISHDGIRRIVLRPKSLYCYLRIDWTRTNGKRRRIDAYLYPDLDLISREKAKGVRRKDVIRELATSLHRTLLSILPANVASRLETRW